jgi:hypothetical protein
LIFCEGWRGVLSPFFFFFPRFFCLSSFHKKYTRTQKYTFYVLYIYIYPCDFSVFLLSNLCSV